VARFTHRNSAYAEPLQPTQKVHSYSQDSSIFEIFWDCLDSIEGIAPEVVQELRQSWTPAAWRPIGELLVRRKVLTLSQVTHLIGLQLDVPYMRIGELAVREGYCTMKEVQQALDFQREECPGPLELLVADQRLEREAILKALLAYSRLLEERVRLFVDNELGKRSA